MDIVIDTRGDASLSNKDRLTYSDDDVEVKTIGNCIRIFFLFMKLKFHVEHIRFIKIILNN